MLHCAPMLGKPFSQCFLNDLIDEILRRVLGQPSSSLGAATFSQIAHLLHDTSRCELILQRHPLVRGRDGLECNGSSQSKEAWTNMLSELLAPLSSSVTDAHRFRLYLHIKEIAKFANVATAPAICVDPPHAYWTAAELASEVAQGALSRYCSVLAGSALDGEMLSCCKDRKEIEEFLVELCSDADDRRCLLDSLERAKSIQPTCQFLEGRLFYGQQRYSDAAKSWGQAALLQHGPSHAFLSQMLYTGRPGVVKDHKRAFELAAAGAALGCAHSKGVLGRCYFNGTGVA